ncbi:MAG TPA: hypothetical protein VGQ39_07005 [Pyrinomonadaceae bacterium]|jgi:hypothetical protein|nr:hypothetical protein [Pyrinomonadaceae bacterium]
MSLEAVGKLVASHSASPEGAQLKIAKVEAEQIVVRQMVNWLTWGMIILGIGVAMLVVNKYFDIGRWFQLASSCLLLGGTGIAAAGVLNAVRQGVNVSGMRSKSSELPNNEPKSLPTNPFPEALPSVTERTTKLISTEDSRIIESHEQ